MVSVATTGNCEQMGVLKYNRTLRARPSNIIGFAEATPLLAKVDCQCAWCGKGFAVWRSRFLRGAKFCSRGCYTQARREFYRWIRTSSLHVVRSPSEGLPELVRGYFRRQFEQAMVILPVDSSALAEVLIELFAFVIGQEELEGWRPATLQEVATRLNQPLVGL
jgi:hypothetical protein